MVAVVITLKTHYPKVDTGSLLKRKPKLLLSTQQRVDEDAVKVSAAAHSMAVAHSVQQPSMALDDMLQAGRSPTHAPRSHAASCNAVRSAGY